MRRKILTLFYKRAHVYEFYPQQHEYYCGIDLHARKMSIKIGFGH